MILFLAELKKVLLIIRHDPRSILAGIIAPSAALVILYLFFGNFHSIPIGIVNEDTGTWGSRLEEAVLSQISPLGQEPYFERVHIDRIESISQFKAGKLAGVLIIPADFSDRVEAGAGPTCIYYLNNYNTDFAKNMRLYLEEGIFAFYSSEYADFAVQIKEIVSAPTQVDWIDVIAVGTLLLAFVIGGMFNYLYVFFRERQDGTVILYKVAPRAPLPSFLARGLAAILSSILAGLFNALLIQLLLGYSVFDSLPAFAPAALLAALTYIAGAAVLGLFARSYGAIIGSMGGAMVFWFFTGGLSDVVPENVILLTVYRALPNSYALDLMRGLAFGTGNLNAGINYAVLMGMAIISLFLALVLYRYKMWRPPYSALIPKLRTRIRTGSS